jgi:hypothetical protein
MNLLLKCLVQAIDQFNPVAWIASNILVAYISILLIVFVIFYFIVFDPRATTAGRFIFRFIISLVGVIGLIFIGNYIDPEQGRAWYQFPGDILWWRPTVRLIVYTYVGYSVTALVVLLAIRKWWPQKLRTALDRDLVKTRRPEEPLPELVNDDKSKDGLS